MNVYSMTGYGKKEGYLGDSPLSIELKSVNNRYLEISMKLPRELNPYELEIKKHISKRVKRGSLSVGIALGQGGKGLTNIQFDQSVLTQYQNAFAEVSSKYGLENDLKLSHFAQLPEIFSSQTETKFSKDEIQSLFATLDEAIDALLAQRASEGSNLVIDLKNRVAFMEGEIKFIEENISSRQGEYKAKLQERLKNLLEDQDIEESRFVQEVAYMADKMDITEEIVRFHSHNKLFIETLNAPGPHGKRLNFILQEMGREANTLSTKSHFIEFQHRAIKLKEEIETLREQIMNIE